MSLQLSIITKVSIYILTLASIVDGKYENLQSSIIYKLLLELSKSIINILKSKTNFS